MTPQTNNHGTGSSERIGSLSPKHGRGKKQKTPVSDVTAMLTLRAFHLLPTHAKNLVASQLDDALKLRQETEGMAPEALAARQAFARLRLAVDDWFRARAKDGVITYTLPVEIALQPDLTWPERMILADVAYLQGAERGCHKSNAGFAVELGLPEKTVKNLLTGLRHAGFLSAASRGGRRLLRLGENVNKDDSGSRIRDLEAEGRSRKRDQKVPEKGPAGLESGTTRSRGNDQKNVNNRRPEPVNTGDNRDQPSRNDFKRQQETTMTASGASAPDPESSSPSSPSAGGGLRPPAPPESNEGWMHTFVELYLLCRKQVWEDEAWDNADAKAAHEFNRQHPEWSPVAALAVIAGAWSLIKAAPTESGYTFGACKRSGCLRHCFRNWPTLVSEVNGFDFPGDDAHELANIVIEGLGDRLVATGLSEEDAAERLMPVIDELDRLYPPKPRERKKEWKDPNCEPGPVTCANCGEMFTGNLKALSMTCPKCSGKTPPGQIRAEAEAK